MYMRGSFLEVQWLGFSAFTIMIEGARGKERNILKLYILFVLFL